MAGTFLFELLSIIFVVANKLLTIYRLLGCFSHSRKRAHARFRWRLLLANTPPPPPMRNEGEMRAVAPCQHYRATYTRFSRVLAPCQNQAFTGVTLESDPSRTNAYARFRGWILFASTISTSLHLKTNVWSFSRGSLLPPPAAKTI
jgi:hypothetical protein